MGERAAYFHRSWVHLPEGVDEAELSHRIEASYEAVRAELTRKAQAALPRPAAR